MNCSHKDNQFDEPKIRFPQGNVLQLGIPLTERIVDGDDVTDVEFIPVGDVNVVLSRGAKKYPFVAQMDGNVALIVDKGNLPAGVYSVSVMCNDAEGNPYKYEKDNALRITRTAEEAGITSPIEFETKAWYLDAAIFLAVGSGGGSLAQVQSDWDQTNTEAVDYIKNKPTIPVVPTDVSAFTNDAGYLTQHQDISGKVDKVQGKGLSSNDYTDAEKTKLAGIAEGSTANVGTVTSVSVNGGEPSTPDTNGNVDLQVSGGQGSNGFTVNETATALVLTVWDGAELVETTTSITIQQ